MLQNPRWIVKQLPTGCVTLTADLLMSGHCTLALNMHVTYQVLIALGAAHEGRSSTDGVTRCCKLGLDACHPNTSHAPMSESPAHLALVPLEDPRHHIQVELDNGILREQNNGTEVSLFLAFLVPVPRLHSWPLLHPTRGALPLAVLMCCHLPKPTPLSMHNFRRFRL